MKTPPWYVITGNVSSGKSTLIQELAIRGYQTVPESSRVLIDRYRANGVSAQELRKDEARFQKMVFELKLQVEKLLPKDKPVFLDRGLPDSIAYAQVCGLNPKIFNDPLPNRYRKIFFLEEVSFEQDYARVEDEQTRKKIGPLLLKAYQDLNYEVIHVPALVVEKRVLFILDRI